MPLNTKKSKFQRRVEREAAYRKAHPEMYPEPSPWIPDNASPMETEEQRKLRETAYWEAEAAKMASKTADQQLKERVDMNLKGWPWKESNPLKTYTRTVFYENHQCQHLSEIKIEKITQSSKLLHVLRIGVIQQKFFRYLAQNHEDATKFCLLCKETFNSFSGEIGVWEVTSGFYQNCENSRHDITVPKELHGSVAPVVIVSPARGLEALPVKRIKGSVVMMSRAREEALMEGWPSSSDADYKAIYPSQVKSLHRMCISMNNYADYFKNLQFHRVPFLTTSILALLIPSMRNLEFLGVFQCQLIHVGHTLRIMDIIRTDRPKGKESQVNLEFFPNRHVGPISMGRYFTGQYGVTWDNFNGRTDIAVWGMIFKLIPKFREYGLNMLADGTTFRKWLDNFTPCWRVAETIAKLEESTDNKCPFEEVIAFVDFKKLRGIGAAVHQYRQYETKAEGVDWLFETKKCGACSSYVRGLFWDFPNWRDHGDCLPCHLNSYLEGETDHYKEDKRDLITHWLTDTSGEVNTTDLVKALDDFHTKKVMIEAWKLDDRRRIAMNVGDPSERVDKEYEERQRPWRREELRKLGKIHRAPYVTEKDADLKAGENWMWERMEETRRWAHGHGFA